MGRARRARPPSIARASTGLSSALPLPAGCQHPTLEGWRVTDLLLATRELAEYLGCRGRRCCGGRGGRDAARPVRPQGRSAGLPTRRRILRLRRAGSRTLPPRKVGSTEASAGGSVSSGSSQRNATQPWPSSPLQQPHSTQYNTAAPFFPTRPPARHAESNSERGQGSSGRLRRIRTSERSLTGFRSKRLPGTGSHCARARPEPVQPRDPRRRASSG